MTELRIEDYRIPAADLGPENPLPSFRSPEVDRSAILEASITAEDRRYLGWRCGYRVLPHRMQDGYNRDKRPRAFRACVLENEILRATFLPELGARLVSLYHKPQKRELLDKNPVFQPANLALRNAWFSGGVEWNTSQLGHYYLTCSPVFAARVRGLQGEPALRVYEWDRVKCFPWQIDFHLPPGSPFLLTRARIVNPHDVEIPMYWWSNMAVPEAPGTRTLAPAQTGLTHVGKDTFGCVPLPQYKDLDLSYGTKVRGARECFFRIEGDQRRWVAALDTEGRGLVQTSTPRLRGRKVFYWGMTPGGRRWQEFLAAPGQAYLEIQAGLARTQFESIPMPARAEWTWAEAYGLLEADPAAVHADWTQAWKTADAALAKALPADALALFEREAAVSATRKPDEVLAAGSGWGALERRRAVVQKRPDPIPPEYELGAPGADQAPWLELLEKGVLPQRAPEEGPGQFMTQSEWEELLEESLRSGRSDHWLGWYHLGNMRMEEFDSTGAREAWNESLQRCRTGWALRNLAILDARQANSVALLGPEKTEPATFESCELLRQAWETGPRPVALAIECAQALLHTRQYEKLRQFITGLSPEHRANERLRLMGAWAALQAGALDEIEPLFSCDFATVREGEVALTDVWFAYHERRLAAAEKLPIDEALKQRVRRECPPPRQIDFRIAME
ncbi:MAG TPA: DUF5107 domain-containing protein [Planctomycetota bacterium]